MHFVSRRRTIFAVIVRASDGVKGAALSSDARILFLLHEDTHLAPTVWLADLGLPRRWAPSPTISNAATVATDSGPKRSTTARLLARNDSDTSSPRTRRL